jgi:hypothetical protein
VVPVLNQGRAGPGIGDHAGHPTPPHPAGPLPRNQEPSGRRLVVVACLHPHMPEPWCYPSSIVPGRHRIPTTSRTILTRRFLPPLVGVQASVPAVRIGGQWPGPDQGDSVLLIPALQNGRAAVGGIDDRHHPSPPGAAALAVLPGDQEPGNRRSSTAAAFLDIHVPGLGHVPLPVAPPLSHRFRIEVR